MAAVTPTAFSATADGTAFIDPHRSIRVADQLGDAGVALKEGTKHRIWHFTASDTDNWLSGIPGIVALATQSDAPATETLSAEVTTQATGDVTFQTSGAGISFWLHVFSR